MDIGKNVPVSIIIGSPTAFPTRLAVSIELATVPISKPRDTNSKEAASKYPTIRIFKLMLTENAKCVIVITTKKERAPIATFQRKTENNHSDFLRGGEAELRENVSEPEFRRDRCH